jgi:hypothetical protein
MGGEKKISHNILKTLESVVLEQLTVSVPKLHEVVHYMMGDGTNGVRRCNIRNNGYRVYSMYIRYLTDVTDHSRKVLCHHRVDIVPGFLSSRPNWLPPPLHPQASVAPPPLVPRGWDTLAGGRGGRGSQFGRKWTDTMVL